MSFHGRRPVGILVAAVLLVCTLSPVLVFSAPAGARVESGEPINGNQELVSHPTLPYIYYGGDGEVIIFDYRSGTETAYPLEASGYAVSLDISNDGTILAAAYSSAIHVLTLSSGVPSFSTVLSSHGGIVKSVCFGSGSNLYVSYENSRAIDAYTAAGGWIASVATTPDYCILEADDSGSVLLAGNLGSVSATTVIKYGLTSDPSAALDETGRYESSIGKLAQFEAAGDKLFIACTGDTGIQVVSLSTMALETRFGMAAKPVGVAVSRDGSIVFGLSSGGSYPPGQTGVIYAFDPSGDQISERFVSSGNGAIAPTPDNWAVVIASPLQIVPVGPEIVASAPAAGSDYGYSPAYVQFNITHDPVIDAGAVTATVDGTAHAVTRITSQTYQINLTSALSAGSHTVKVVVPWGGQEVAGQWTFTTGSTSPGALRPVLSLVEPAAGSVIVESPDRIVLSLGSPPPPPFAVAVTVGLNDITLNAVADVESPGRYIATLPSGLDLEGNNTVNATADVDGLALAGSWRFEVNEDAGPDELYEIISYGDNFTIPMPAVWTEQRDFGGWELAITGPSYNGVGTNVFVDIAHDPSVRGNQAYINTYAQTVLTDTIEAGDPAEMVGDVNYTAISNLTAGTWKIRLTEQGVQEAYALIVDETNGNRWLIKCSASDTSFIDIWPIFEHMISGVRIEAPGAAPVVVPPGTQGYAYYRMPGDYQLMVPDNWTVKREAASGGTTVSLKLTGPQVGEFHVTILLQNGTDPGVRDDRAFLLDLVHTKFLPELEAKGIQASVYEEPRVLSISDLSTLVFSIRWTDLRNNMSLVQEIYFIADEQNQRYWMFTCETPEEAYGTYVQIFDRVAQSFTPLGGSDTTAPGGLLSDPTTGLMVAVLAVTGAAAAIVFLAARRYRSN